MSTTVQQVQHGPAGKKAASRIFLRLNDLLAYYGRTAPARNAILARGRPALTYGGLWVCAKRLARALRRFGIGPSDRVAVVLPGGPEAAVAILAVASAAVCVPLNPRFTADEWTRYLADLRVSALLTSAGTDTAGRKVAITIGIPVVDLAPRPSEGSGAFSLIGPAAARIVGGEKSSSDDAFILLTSGTSSRPKMVPLTHAAVCLSAYNVGATLALRPQDRLLNVLPLFHGHGLISGLVAALAAGSSVVCPPGFDADAFFGWVAEFRPTWYTAVPAIHRAVLSAAARHKNSARRSSLRLVRSASSTLPAELLGSLEALFDVPVIDTYGMTETATQIAANPLRRRKVDSVGKAAGPEIAIFDPEGRRLPAGKRGEIALRGPTIMRGYDNDAAANAAAFRDGWFRTGDLGYLDEEGYLFIVGRIKDIIDRGGQKIAPAEVEQALLTHPDVIEAAVFPVPHTRLGTDVGAAVVLRDGAKVNAHGLREFARGRLAGFKIPGLIRTVPEIPKGPAGKIKRGDLLAALSTTLPSTREERGGELLEPRSELQRQLADTWKQLLEIDHIGVDENIFSLGADSITVTQMLSRLRARFGVDFSFKDIVDAPTIAALSRRLDSSKKRLAPRRLADLPVDATGVEEDASPQPVSIVQERMLQLEGELPGLPQFNLPFAYRLQGPLNIAALERSLIDVTRRHGSLRTRFVWRDGAPVALLSAARNIKSCLIIEDLAGREPRTSRAKARVLRRAELRIEQESLKPIDVSNAPLFRARLFRLGPGDHVLLLTVHDIIIDGWSMTVFMKELSDLYSAYVSCEQTRLPKPALRFSDFASSQRRWSTSPAANRQLAYWQRRLRKASPIFASNDIAGELVAPITQQRFDLPTDLVGRLSALSHSRETTLFVGLLAGFKTLLLLRSGRHDICVATMMANRSQLRAERVIGPFANTALIRTQMDADLSFQEALHRVRDAVVEAYTRQDLPFDIIAARLAEEDGFDPGSLVQFYFILQVAFRRRPKLHDVAVRPFGYRQGQSAAMPIDRTWLRMTLTETPSGITGTCRYKNDLFAPTTVEDWTEDYTAILAQAAADPKKSLGRLADR